MQERTAEEVTAAVAEKIGALAVRLATRMSPQQVGEFLIEVVYEMFVGEVRGRELVREEMALLAELARADWRRVSPGILGTLLERALAPGERKQLGAFYTADRQIRLVVEKTVLEPLRAEWVSLRGARGAEANFCGGCGRVRVLDPACGTGNFLVVAFTLLREFETEVASALGVVVEERAVQLLGIEVDPWAARVAELVLRIAYLQAGAAWRHRIELGDALIVVGAERRARVDATGRAVMRAGGVTERRAAREDGGGRGVRGGRATRVAGGGLHRREPAVPGEQADERRARGGVRRRDQGGLSGGARERGPGDVVVVARGGAGGARRGAALRAGDDEQHLAGV
jgi:hypothetical protein